MQSEGGIRLGPLGIILALVGVLGSYLASLHGAELNQQSLVAFAVWSLAALLVAFLIDFLFKFVLILVVLFVAALWWTENPLFETAAVQATDIRTTLCGKIPDDLVEYPVKDWIC